MQSIKRKVSLVIAYFSTALAATALAVTAIQYSPQLFTGLNQVSKAYGAAPTNHSLKQRTPEPTKTVTCPYHTNCGW